MTYTDEDGKTKDDYKDEAPTDLARWWNAATARKTGKLYEYKFTFSTTAPETGGYFKNAAYIIYDGMYAAATAIRSAMKFKSQYVGSPSGLGLFDGQSTFFDGLQTPSFGGQKMYYITDVWYRTQDSADSWTHLGQPARSHIIDFPILEWSGDDLVYMHEDDIEHIMGEDISGDIIWNHNVGVANSGKNRRLSMTTLKALGQEIDSEFFDERGLEGTVNNMFKSDIDGNWYRGTDAYWTTHGFPNGRRYRVWADGKIDVMWAAATVLLIRLLKKSKIRGTVLKQVTKQLSKRLGKLGLSSDVNDIIDKLDSDPEKSLSFRALNDQMTKLLYIYNKFLRAYSPQKGVLRM